MKNAILLTLEEGGVTLLALLVLAVMIYALVFGVWWRGLKTWRRVRSGEWSKAREVRSELPWHAGHAGRRELERKFASFELDEMAWVERRLPFLTVLIAAAPLLGLLGTVAGMLVSFDGLAGSAGGEPIDTISAGISKALVTTQAGLVIAVPAAFLLALLKRQSESSHLELQRQLHDQLATRGGEA
ncbi:MotA/TolQ/ExbB proton channel family protein [Haloferula rosea]|uniref:MotA/TolQ/ExbB proton channel family protein n=1 Tax=Haloferula rosea TaxID=490093 RepID=A0A934VFE8_9BACT|nr:MotA/TolQ/ExbB proton channel family protein [Haloferula rosea]MBK1828289.1 MotA/TolQ/ExbB proton channel family protein [Haloferula rosea]